MFVTFESPCNNVRLSSFGIYLVTISLSNILINFDSTSESISLSSFILCNITLKSLETSS